MKNRFAYYSGIIASLLFIQSTFATGSIKEKLDFRLHEFVGIAPTIQSQQKEDPLLNSNGDILVQIYLETDIQFVHNELEDAGLNIHAAYKSLVDGSINPNYLGLLAAQEYVSFIEPLRPAQHMAVEGEEIQSLRVADIRNNAELNFDGSGVKVGIISNSFAWRSENERTIQVAPDGSELFFELIEIPDIDGDGIPELTQTDSHLSGDLTQPVELVGELDPNPFFGNENFSEFNFPTNFDEGRALAEVVNEIAPGAELAYYGAGTDAQLAQAVEALAGVGCNVIVDDVGAFGSPLYQNSLTALAMKDAVEQNDVVFITSLGNSGSQAIEAAFLDSNPDAQDEPDSVLPQGNDLHNWNASNSENYPHTALDITLPPNTSTTIYMYWEEPWNGTLGPGASTNYDIYAFSKPDSHAMEDLVNGANNVQGENGSPSGIPLEAFSLQNTSDETVTYYIKVNLKSGKPKNFKLFFSNNVRNNVNFQHDIWRRDTFVSVGHPNSIYTLGVAAVHYFENDSLGQIIGNPREITQTYYSSRGGMIDFMFSDTGEPLTVPNRRYKPDISSIDTMNTSFYGGDIKFDDDELFNFLGTSAAAPAAAGVIALMRSANPSLSADEIRQYARAAATDIGSPGFDFYTGHGLLYADDAIKQVLNPTAIINWEFWNPNQQ